MLLLFKTIDTQPSPANLPSVNGNGSNGVNGQWAFIQQFRFGCSGQNAPNGGLLNILSRFRMVTVTENSPVKIRNHGIANGSVARKSIYDLRQPCEIVDNHIR